MPSDSIISSATTRAAFRGGEDLVASGSVASWQAQRTSHSTVEVRGTVDDGGATFDAMVSLDFGSERTVGHRCTCNAQGKGLCRHSAALGLSYLAYLNANRPTACVDATSDDENARPTRVSDASPQRPLDLADSDDLIRRLKAQTQDLLAHYKAEDACTGAQRTAAAIPELQTSLQVSRAIYAYAQARAAQEGAEETASRPEPDQRVELFPTLVPCGRIPGCDAAADSCIWELRLRIGTPHTVYQVRQIDELVRAWELRETRSYGRNLAFEHTPRVFSARACDLLDFVARVLHTQDAARAAQRQMPGSPSWGPSAKTLPLSDRDAAELLDLMQGSTVQFETRTATGNPRAATLEVCEGDPGLVFEVVRGERGGFDLAVPAGCDCVLTNDRMYLLFDGHAWRCGDAYRERMGTFCRALLPASQPFHIREADMAGFCGTVLPAVSCGAFVNLPEDLEVLLPPPAKPAFRIALARGLVTCEAVVGYGPASLDLFEPAQPGQPVRDFSVERAARDAVRSYFPNVLPTAAARIRMRAADAGPGRATYPWPAGTSPEGRPCFDEQDTERLYLLLSDGARRFSELGDVYLTDNLRSIGIKPAPRVRVEASVKSGLLDISVDSSDLSPHDLLAYLASFERQQRFVRLTSGDIVRLDDGGVKAVAELADALGVSASSLVDGSAVIPANRALFVDATMKRSEGVRFDRDESFRSIIRDFDSIGDNDFVEPTTLRDVLRSYQREGFKWISTLAKLGFGGILADDMGLGKTLQVIAFLLARHEAGERLPNLVVCPASLVYNWMDEIGRFAPALRAVAVVGSKEQRAQTVQTACGYDVLVTSYELLKRDVDCYARQQFYCQVLDEAQYIKNHTTQAARCVKRVDARVRLALTGTPIENRLSELWSIFDYLMPGLLGGYDAFRRRFEVPISSGDEACARRLQCMVGPFILRRLKRDVLKDLPEKNESVVFAHMDGEQDKLYRATASQLALTLAHQLPADFAAQRIAVLAELTKLRQICCDPSLLYENFEGSSAKLEICLELVANAVDGGHKVLLFSQFTSMLRIISARLDEMGVAHYALTGATPKEERARLVSSFATDATSVFLISLKAGGVGLNLTAADIVIHYDPWWNLAAQNQATDRAHRIGQTNTVSVIRLIAKDTIEEKIVQLQEAKRGLAETIMGGDAVGTANLTKEDILALLEP